MSGDSMAIGTTCEERAGKYALKIGKLIGLSDEDAWKLRDAYVKSCGKWEEKYRAGIWAYIVGPLTKKEDFTTVYKGAK
jgi:hypothetical protein